MKKRQARILLAKLGEPSDRSQLELAKALSKAGFEVIYTDLEDPEAIAESAVQEGVDHIGITVLSAITTETFAVLQEALERENAGDVTVSAGGRLTGTDFEAIYATGIKALFPLGTSIDDLVAWAQENIHPTVPESATDA